VVLQAPLAGAAITVWLKRMDVADAQYVEVENLDLEQTVSKFKARWVAQAKLDVDPSLVTLRLVKRGAGKPTAKQEEKAKPLDDPSLSLAEVKVTGTAWLLAFVAGTLHPRRASALPPADGTRSRDGRGRAPLSVRAQVGPARGAGGGGGGGCDEAAEGGTKGGAER
jgi:hypothetical protein